MLRDPLTDLISVELVGTGTRLGPGQTANVIGDLAHHRGERGLVHLLTGRVELDREDALPTELGERGEASSAREEVDEREARPRRTGVRADHRGRLISSSGVPWRMVGGLSIAHPSRLSRLIAIIALAPSPAACAPPHIGLNPKEPL